MPLDINFANPFSDENEQDRYAEDNPMAAYDAVLGNRGYTPDRNKFHRGRFNDMYRNYMANTANTIFGGESPETGWRDYLSSGSPFEDDYFSTSPFQRGNAPHTLYAPPIRWVGV